MTSPLNGPLEVGIRMLMVLTESFPEHLDVSRLVLLDHGVLHSADFGGPNSLHPPLPIRSGELGIKRSTVEQGLQVMMRAGLVEMLATEHGIRFQASDTAYSFLSLLSAEYAATLRERARWAVEHFESSSDEQFRAEMRSVVGHWTEEFSMDGQRAPRGRASS